VLARDGDDGGGGGVGRIEGKRAPPLRPGNEETEGGAEPSAETLRVLAEALELEVNDLRTKSRRKHFGAPGSQSLKWTTWLVVTLLVVLGIVIPYGMFFSLAIGLTCYLLSVSDYSLQNDQLVVLRVGWATRFPLTDITEITINPHATMGSIRLFGVGGVSGYIGRFHNSVIGDYRAYATDSKFALVVGLGGATIVVAPDDPGEMKAAVEDELRRLAEAGRQP
jgi:hypothetical protein